MSSSGYIAENIVCILKLEFFLDTKIHTSLNTWSQWEKAEKNYYALNSFFI